MPGHCTLKKMEKWEDRLSRSALTDRQTGNWTNCQTSSSLQFTCSSLQWLGFWSMSPSSPAPLAVNWAPARPRPFIASICQSLQAWMLPETLYKWGASFHLYLTLSLHLFNALSSLRANRSDPGLFGANSGSIKAVAQTSPWAGGSCSPPAPPRSLSLNHAVAWYFTAGYMQVYVAKLLMFQYRMET